MFSDSQKQKIENKLGNYKCPICGGRDKFFTEVPTHVISFPQTPNGYDFTKVRHMDCLCVHCLNCGHMDQFLLSVLLK